MNSWTPRLTEWIGSVNLLVSLFSGVTGIRRLPFRTMSEPPIQTFTSFRLTAIPTCSASREMYVSCPVPLTTICPSAAPSLCSLVLPSLQPAHSSVSEAVLAPVIEPSVLFSLHSPHSCELQPNVTLPACRVFPTDAGNDSPAFSVNSGVAADAEAPPMAPSASAAIDTAIAVLPFDDLIG